MSGSVLGVTVMAASILAAGLTVSVLSALPIAQSVQNAADAAALAAADTVSGAASGLPCEVAARAAAVNGASVVDCAVDGPVASVIVGRTALGFVIRSEARAGPP
jgi:secretion/DNA translocation related TadE-like protein